MGSTLSSTKLRSKLPNENEETNHRKRDKKTQKTRCNIDELFSNTEKTLTTMVNQKSVKKSQQHCSSSTEHNELDERYPPLKPLERSGARESTDGGPLSQYSTGSEVKGPIFIIHNFSGPNFEYRAGSSHDVGNLINVFEQLHFSTDKGGIQANLTAEEMIKFCKASASRDFSQIDCIVMVILTHGTNFGLLQGVDGKGVRLDKLISPFYGDNSPTLIGKPKIFIIQACRGKKSSFGVKEPNRDETRGCSTSGDKGDTNKSTNNVNLSEFNHDFEDVESSGFLPRNADIVVAFATSDDEQAFRRTTAGSYYVNELTLALFQNTQSTTKKHFVDILTYVQGRMSNLTFTEGCVQMPEFRSTLRGPIYI